MHQLVRNHAHVHDGQRGASCRAAASTASSESPHGTSKRESYPKPLRAWLGVRERGMLVSRRSPAMRFALLVLSPASSSSLLARVASEVRSRRGERAGPRCPAVPGRVAGPGRRRTGPRGESRVSAQRSPEPRAPVLPAPRPLPARSGGRRSLPSESELDLWTELERALAESALEAGTDGVLPKVAMCAFSSSMSCLAFRSSS